LLKSFDIFVKTTAMTIKEAARQHEAAFLKTLTNLVTIEKLKNWNTNQL